MHLGNILGQTWMQQTSVLMRKGACVMLDVCYFQKQWATRDHPCSTSLRGSPSC